ncbi:hypothetical protein FI667_g7372, partial [Globisporangium splendens]
MDAAVGSHKISLEVTTSTKAGYQMKSIIAQIVAVNRGALVPSLESCANKCGQHNLCKMGVSNTVAKSCNLFMASNQSALVADAARTTFRRALDPNASENVWTRLTKRRWDLTSSESLLSRCEGENSCAALGCSSAKTTADRCRCVCRATNGCIGFSYENDKCFQITADALRQTMASGSYSTVGNAVIHINVPPSCNKIKMDAVAAASGVYILGTSTGFFLAYCDMVSDAGKGYTIVPCDFGASDVACLGTTGPSDYDTCKAMGLTQVVPRSSSHFIAMHKKYGSSYFATAPGISNAVLNAKLDLPSDNSASSQWGAVDAGKWWLRDIIGTDNDSIECSTRPGKKILVGMHDYAAAQSVSDGVLLKFDTRGIQTTRYLCSTNDAAPSTLWSTVLQDSFNGNKDDNLWVTSWGGTDKWYQLCNGITILGVREAAKQR